MSLIVNSKKRNRLRPALQSALRSMGVTWCARTIVRQVVYRQLLKSGVCRQALGRRKYKFSVSSITEVERVSRFAEREFVERILASIQDGDVFYDVGANIGLISLAVAGCGADVSVHAFEPEARNFDSLNRNKDLNGLENLQSHRLALANETRPGKLFVSGEAGTGTHSLLNSGASSQEAQTISIVKGDEFVNGQPQSPTVLKVDVEGAEVDVLTGLEQTLRWPQLREIFLEVHPALIESTGWNAERLVRWVQAQGFAICWLSHRVNESHYHFQRCARAA